MRSSLATSHICTPRGTRCTLAASGALSCRRRQQTQQIFDFVATALDLMSAPRRPKNVSFPYESTLLMVVREWLTGNAHISREHLDVVQAALDRLVSSGVIEERGLGVAEDYAVRWSQRLEAKAKAQKEAPERQSCAHCGARELHVDHFKRCAACKGPRFCSKECQLANWPAHKALRRPARRRAKLRRRVQQPMTHE